MDEAESLADDVIIIHGGKVIFSGPIDQARKAIGKRFKVEVYGGLDLGGYDCIKLKGMTIYYVNESEAEEVLRRAVRRGFDATIKTTSLEDLFIKLTGERIEEGA